MNYNGIQLDTTPTSLTKEALIDSFCKYMLNRTQSMFEYKGLPETIPVRNLELMLQWNGNVGFAQVEGDLYAFTGGLGGLPDPYYMPTLYTVANPALNLSRVFQLGKDCVVMPNDSMYLGLKPLFMRYSSMLADNVLTMRGVMKTYRTPYILSAPDDKTKRSCEIFLDKMDRGETAVVGETAFLDGIKTHKFGETTSLTNLIELQQYLLAGWYNELGLQANYNMKRESINTNEAQMNNDALIPLVEDMLNCRRTALEKVNELFGTSISVDLKSSWQARAEEVLKEEETLEEEGEIPEETQEVEEVAEGETERN